MVSHKILVVILVLFHWPSSGLYHGNHPLSPHPDGYSIDWAARNEGDRCRIKCINTTAYAGGYCAAILSFVGTGVCAAFRLVDPLQCSLVEGPFFGISALCGANILERVCERCDEPYSNIDLLNQQRIINQKFDNITHDMDNMSRMLQERSAVSKKTMSKIMSKLRTMTSFHLSMFRYDRILSRINFLNFLFNRMESTKQDGGLEYTRIRDHYLNTARETSYQMGLPSLIYHFHSLLVGLGTSIYGEKQSSLFETDPEFCTIDNLNQIDVTLFNLLFQMNYIKQVDNTGLDECLSLQDWVQELRQLQHDHINKVCKNILPAPVANF